MARYLMYMDESGEGTLNDFQSKFFVLTGLIVQEEEDVKVSGYFNYTKKKYDIPQDIPFHSYELFEKRSSSLRLSPKKARGFLKSVSEFFRISPIRIAVVAVKKDDIRKFYMIPKNHRFISNSNKYGFKDLPYDILGRELFFWFTRFLYRQGGVGHIIAEARGHSDHAVLQTFLDSQEKYRFMKSSPEFKLTQNFKKRVTSISFTKKNGLRGNLEMVDLISYFSYQFLEKNLKKITRIGGRIIWRCIKEEMEKQKIQRIKTNGFKKLVPYVKARNLANYINQLSTKSRKSIN